MSDVPQRPRIRPATSDDWQKDQGDSAGQKPSYGNEAERSSAVFDNSTYYEYLERHTGEQAISKTRSDNVLAPVSRSPFGDRAAAQPQSPADDSGGSGRPPRAPGPAAGNGPQVPPPPQFAPSVPPQADSKPRSGLKVAGVIIALTLVLALVAFFGIWWLAPSSGTVPVDVGPGESSDSPTPTEELVQPSQTPEEKLDALTQQGTQDAADLEGQWVTQLSAKNVGLKADGKTWTAPDILNEYEANKVKYPGAILIHSGDWASYKDGSYWVTVIDTGYSDPEPALDQCRSWGLDRDHCLAKRLVKDGSPKDNSAYLDE